MDSLALAISTMMLVTSNTGVSEDDFALINTSADLALKSIRDTEAIGVDVSELVNRFNQALDLLQQAESGDLKTCSDNDCIMKSGQILASIVRDASQLQRASHKSEFSKIMNVGVYAPVGALVGSIAIFYAHSAWRSIQLKRFLDLIISEKEK